MVNQLSVFVARWQHESQVFYFMKNYKIANNSTTTKAIEKIAQIWNS
jgi:hypothetical protein